MIFGIETISEHLNIVGMNKEQDLKEMVKQKYGEIALQTKELNQQSCCGAGNASTEVYNIMIDSYSEVAGYNADADLGLGCGLPTQFAKIKSGDTVIDLGSGAGNDCFVARSEAGAEGTIIGIDFTTAMIERARENTAKMGYSNVEFRQGDIEDLPVASDKADVIISNCVLNLVPNKENVFKEIFRVLKPGGHFSISDIVLIGALPNGLQQAGEMYSGCVAGAIQKEDYLALINRTGFQEVTIQKQKAIIIPDDIIGKYLSPDELNAFKSGDSGIFSITVFAQKPVDPRCCDPMKLCC